jgi:hypothetical protein
MLKTIRQLRIQTAHGRIEAQMIRILLSAVTTLVLVNGAFAQTPSKDEQVRQTVQSFYAAFNAHGFESAEKYMTEDWNHVNPFGGWTRGREAVLKELGSALYVSKRCFRYCRRHVGEVCRSRCGGRDGNQPDEHVHYAR